MKNSNVSETNVRKCNCHFCKKTLKVGQGKRVDYHGESYFFICKDCADYDSIQDDTPRLKGTKNGFVYALEIEEAIENINENKLRVLGYSRKYECTVNGDEWVSKPNRNLNGMAKMLRFQMEHGLIVESGTHLNISNETYDNEFYRYCQMNYTAIFERLHNAIQSNDEKTAYLFGRKMNGWCNSLQYWGKSTPIRVEYDEIEPNLSRFEFRIAKLVTPTQYLATIKHCRNLMTIIYNGYINQDKFDEIARKLENYYNKQ